MEEIFKEIKNYENYLVSNYGTIKRKNGKEIKPFESNGYNRVRLYKNGKQKNFKVHRLVAEAFIPNPKNLKFVNHKNEIKNDNLVENLEWCDFKYNLNYGTCQKRKGETLKKLLINRKDLSKQVYQYNKQKELVGIYPSIQEASRQTGILYSLISKCCNNHLRQTHKYIWKFKFVNNTH